MDLEAAEKYLTERVHESPLGSPQQRDYLARRRRVRRLIAAEDGETEPPPAA